MTSFLLDIQDISVAGTPVRDAASLTTSAYGTTSKPAFFIRLRQPEIQRVCSSIFFTVRVSTRAPSPACWSRSVVDVGLHYRCVHVHPASSDDALFPRHLHQPSMQFPDHLPGNRFAGPGDTPKATVKPFPDHPIKTRVGPLTDAGFLLAAHWVPPD